MKKPTIEQQTFLILCRLGLTRCLRGFDMCITAVRYVKDNSESLMYMTKEIYPYIAKKHNCSVNSVERNIRTCAQNAYKNNRKYLSELAYFELFRPPSAGQFLSILEMNVDDK